MISSKSTDHSHDALCQYSAQCRKSRTDYCRGCGQVFCKDHYFEHQEKLKEHLEYVTYTLASAKQEWNSFMSELPADAVMCLINQIYEYSLTLDAVERAIVTKQRQFQNLINASNESTPDQNNSWENDLEEVKKDIEKLQLKLEEMSNNSSYGASEELSDFVDDQSETVASSSLNDNPRKERWPVRLLVNNSSNLESKEEADNEEDEMVVFLDSNAALQINHKIHFANNIVRWLRGPFKAMVHGIMNTVDLCAQGTHISDYALQAVRKGLAKQNQAPMNRFTTNNSVKPTFVEITSDWKLEAENSNQGYSSTSLWIRDPQQRRILIKIQQLPLCAANEWLAYVLGKALGLPVNEVQIAIYDNQLASLHTDAQDDDEKTLTFTQLPKKKRAILLKNPIMEQMDIFDHVIQNADRNQENVLITLPESIDINNDDNDDATMKVKVHFIDHASSFGMGKLGGLSAMAAKFHSHHLSVVKFDPIQKSRQFEEYLQKLPTEDRPLIGKTLCRFADITDDQFDSWISEIQDLLSSSQYHRIYCVLRRQRDIAKRYTALWGISHRCSGVESNKTEEDISENE
jgi:flagellar hook-basal body complex protein FliE